MWGEETPTIFKIDQKQLNDSEDFKQFSKCVRDLYDIIPESNIHFRCEFIHEDSGFSLVSNIFIEKLTLDIQEFEIETDVDILSIFDDDGLISELQKWQNAYNNKKLLPTTELEALIENCISSGEINNIKMSFSFEKKGILSQIPTINADEFNVIFFLSFDNFKKHLKQVSLFDFKNSLLSNKLGTLLLIEGLESNYFGDYVGFFDLKDSIDNGKILENFLTNAKRDIEVYSTKINETISDINLDFLIPPQYFNFINSSQCTESIKFLFYPALLFNLLISFSDSVERINDCCKLTINSKRIVYSQMKITVNDSNLLLLDGIEIDYVKYSKNIGLLYTFYLKIFGMMDTRELDETKIFLSKKIVSIYARTYFDFLKHIEDIINSTKSEYRLYIRDKVDRFINFKEQLINYTFNQNKELIKFNSNLSETLSNTFFRIIGFILVFLIGFVAKADDVLGATYILFVPILLMLLIVFSIYRLDNIKTLYDENNKHHKSYMNYFGRYLGQKDINELSKTIDNSIFNKGYARNHDVLVLLLIICICIWFYANFASFLSNFVR